MKAISLLLIAAMLSSCTAAGIMKHNTEVDAQKALIVRMNSEGNLEAGVDILAMKKGFFGWWAADPIGAFRCVATDTIIGGSLIYLAKRSGNGGTSDLGASGVVIQGDINSPVNITIVTGDNNSSNGDDNTAGTSNRDQEGI